MELRCTLRVSDPLCASVIWTPTGARNLPQNPHQDSRVVPRAEAQVLASQEAVTTPELERGQGACIQKVGVAVLGRLLVFRVWDRGKGRVRGRATAARRRRARAPHLQLQSRWCEGKRVFVTAYGAEPRSLGHVISWAEA